MPEKTLFVIDPTSVTAKKVCRNTADLINEYVLIFNLVSEQLNSPWVFFSVNGAAELGDTQVDQAIVAIVMQYCDLVLSVAA